MSAIVRLSAAHFPGPRPPLKIPLASVMFRPPTRTPSWSQPSHFPRSPVPEMMLTAAGLPLIARPVGDASELLPARPSPSRLAEDAADRLLPDEAVVAPSEATAGRLDPAGED